MGDGDAGRDIGVEKQFLHCHRFRMKLRNEFIQVTVDLIKSARELRFGRCRDHTTGQQPLTALVRIQNREADRSDPRVNA